MKSLMEMKPPTTLSSVRGILGLANFYRSLLGNYSKLEQPLTCLTTKASKYHGGQMPDSAVKVF